MAIEVKLEGFDELLQKIEEAGGSIDDACESAIKHSAEIMETELKNAMQKAKVSSSLINRMPKYEVQNKGTFITAKVGYKSTSYDPNNLSDYFKAIFLNFGTPSRSKHGKVKARGFVKKAKTNAKRKIKNQQEEALHSILERLGL